MFKTALRNLLAHRFRLLATGLAIMLGVAFMAGTLVLTDTLGRTLDTMFANAYADTDAVVRSEAAFEDPVSGWEMRGRIDAALVEQVAGVAGVAVAEGDVWGFAQLVGEDGETIGHPGMGPPTAGTNWYAANELNTWDLAEGRGPFTRDEVVLDKRSADLGGYSVGEQATILARGAPIKATVVGIATIGGADSPGGASFMMFTTAAAQEYVGEPGKFDSISAAGEPGISQEELARRIRTALPGGIEVMTGAALTRENQDAMQQALSFFNTFMLVFAVIALLVGGFMIFNTFFITVAQRTRENALLRAMGASRRQVLAAVLLEAVGVGLVASLVGLAAGVVIAGGLKALLDALGFSLPMGGVVFTAGTALVSFGAGMAVTLVAAMSPARKAGRVPPVAALRDLETSSSAYGSKQRIVVGVAVLAAGAGGLLYGLLANPSSAISYVGGGALLVFFGVSILGRTISLPLSRVIGWPLPRLRGIAGRLARENAMRNPKRTATTASALMIGVGLVAFITIFAASTKASFGKTVDRALSGDFVVTAGAFGVGGGLPSEFTARLNDLPEIETAAGLRAGAAEVDGTVDILIAAAPDTFDIFDVDVLQGSPAALTDPGAIAVWDETARDKGLVLGDRVPVVFQQTGNRELELAMIYGENGAAGDWLVGTAAFEANFPDQLDIQVLVKKSPAVTAAAALAAVEHEADIYPGAKVLDQTEYKAEQLAVIDQMLGLVYALLALAILIALLGIGNTLALSIVERTRELGVLRAVGMTRAQLRSAIRWESVIIALQGTALGLVVGVFFGWALVTAMADEGLNTFAVPVPRLAVVVVLAALAGVVAAVLPARRAARLDVLRAVVTE